MCSGAPAGTRERSSICFVMQLLFLIMQPGVIKLNCNVNAGTKHKEAKGALAVAWEIEI